ncbi:MAG: LysR family transcriptional regulator [Gammaproteobacteria bacterium]|nr:LysR family transcriptional regulator [Gammaproteobacteria bacterium]
MYDDIALFIEIVRNNSLSLTASSLDIPVATVSRRLKKLESQIGVRLIHRSARQFVLTQEGQAYYHSYAGLFAELEQIQKNLSIETHELKGKLRILAPTNISTGLLQAMWLNFIQQYPDIQLEVILNNSFDDIYLKKADLAIRIGPQTDSSLQQKRLSSIATIFVASPNYIDQFNCPEEIDDLSKHRLIGVTALSNWQLKHQETGQEKVFRPYYSTMVNDLSFARQLVCGGAGIALLPVSEAQKALEQRELVHLLPEWQGPERDVYIVWPSGKLLSARAKCFRDFIVDHFEKTVVLKP